MVLQASQIEAVSMEHPAEVKRLLAAARENGEQQLDLTWSGNSLGGHEGARRFGALFNRMYGVNVRVIFTPGPSMTDMAGKVTQELAAGRKASTDVLLGSEQHYGVLLNREVLEEYDYTKLSPRITKEIVAHKNLGVEIYNTIPGIVYNTTLVSSSDLPRKLEDVLHPKWKGKIASTLNAAYFDRVAMRPEWGADKMKAFVAKLSENLGGLIRVGEESRIISGEFVMLVLGNTHSVREAQAKGAPLAFVIPENVANVGFLHLGVPRNAHHSNLAKLFVNTVVSEEGQKILFDVYYADHYALPGSQTASELMDLKAKGVKILEIDVAFTAGHPEMRKLGAELEKILREKR
jgi:ABC-type Fe3+ transport system substrate-binding protein